MVIGVLKTDVEQKALEEATVLATFTALDGIAKSQSASQQRDRVLGQATPVQATNDPFLGLIEFLGADILP